MQLVKKKKISGTPLLRRASAQFATMLAASFAAMLLAMPAAAFKVPEGLFAVDVPVTAQSDDERARAAGEGLLVLLTRLSGLTKVPRNLIVEEALEAPQRYYTQYRFYTQREPDPENPRVVRPQSYVKLTYQADAVLDLLAQANLPVWGTQRPVITAWVVVDTAGRRELLTSNSEHPIAAAVERQAAFRGLALNLPDQADAQQAGVDADDVWARKSDLLGLASQTYETDIILIGRIRATGEINTQVPMVADWQYRFRDERQGANARSLTPDGIAGPGIERLANKLASVFAVTPQSVQRHSVEIVGLESIADYAALLSYLNSLEFIDAVHIDAIRGGEFFLGLESQAQLSQMLMLMTMDPRMAEVNSLGAGLGVKLSWQG